MRRKVVTAFIDWNSQIANAKQRGEVRIRRQVEQTAYYVVRKISELLPGIEKSIDLFQVEMRIYYGWHKGLTPTPGRVILERLIQDNEVQTTCGNSRFNWTSPFGDVLLGALDVRLHPRIKVHLPNTLRTGLDGGPDREKMVDTALVCDLLCSARSEPDNIRLVMAEDDDIVPALYVSERWSNGRNGKTIVARTRSDDGHLSMSGLVHRI